MIKKIKENKTTEYFITNDNPEHENQWDNRVDHCQRYFDGYKSWSKIDSVQYKELLNTGTYTTNIRFCNENDEFKIKKFNFTVILNIITTTDETYRVD